MDDQDKANRDLCKEIQEVYDYQTRQLTPIFSRMSRYHRLWMGERKDPRKEHEKKWRSLSWLGDPFQQTSIEVAVLMDSLNSIDPPYGPEGVSTEDEWKARAFVRALDYFFKSNRWISTQEMALTSMGIQGWTILETTWREQTYQVTQRPPREERIGYDQAVKRLQMQGVPSPPDPVSDPEGHGAWVQSAQSMDPSFPNPPAIGPRTVVAYRGPWFNRPSDFTFRFDPFVEDWQEQECIIKRVVKPWKWVESQAGPEDDKPFDPAMVQKAKSNTTNERLTQWDREIASQFGIPFDNSDPIYKDGVELWEVWRPKNKQPHVVICGRDYQIKKRPDVYPWWHHQFPFVCVRNIPLKGMAVGMSSYQQLEQAFADRVKFRDILFDGLVLSVMPVFLKTRSLGMSDMSKFLEPGKILEVSDANGFKPGWQSMPGFSELVQVVNMILQEENLFLSTGDNVRGQPVTVNRVSATEAQSRLTQALMRHKQKAIRLEEEFTPIIPQSLSMVGQKWPSEDQELATLRAKIIGEDQEDPWLDQDLTRDTFNEDVNRNIKFNGASRVKDRNLLAQQLKDFLQFGASIQVAPGIPALLGVEVRAGLRRIYETLGHKGAAQIVTKEGDEIIAQGLQSTQLQVQTSLMQQQQQLQQMQQPPQPQAPPPQKITYKDAPPDVQGQMEQAAGLQPSQDRGAMLQQQMQMQQQMEQMEPEEQEAPVG